jgi:hypothetical protein
MVQINKNGYDLGALEDGAQVGDVVLPPWAKGDPYKFIRIHREALESDYVSAHLHKWIGMLRSKGFLTAVRLTILALLPSVLLGIH